MSQLHTTNAEAWLLYRHGLITIMPPTDLARVAAAQQLFQRAHEVDHSFAGGYAGQSFAHSTRALFMNSADSQVELTRAIEFAEQAVALDQDFGANYAMLSFAQVLAGDIEQAELNGLKSMAIQPGDAFSQFIMGLNRLIAKRPESSIQYLREAVRLEPLESRMPYLNLLGVAYYAIRDYSKSLATIEFSNERGGPRGPHTAVFVAASYAQLGEEELARKLIVEMQQKYPGFSYRGWIERWLTDLEQQQETLVVLRQLGLPLD